MKPFDAQMVVEKTSATEATCTCPCGMVFFAEAIEERQMVYDPQRRLLRAVCPRCGRLEDVVPFWNAAKDTHRDPHPNRIAEFLR